MGSLSERGTLEPSKPTVVFWGALTGAVAAIMLIIGDGGSEALAGLQSLTIVVSLPLVIVMVLFCYSLYKALRTDPIILREDIGAGLVEGAAEGRVQGRAEAHADARSESDRII